MKLVALMLLMAGNAVAQNAPKDVPAACGDMKVVYDASVADDGRHVSGTAAPGNALVYFIQDLGFEAGEHFTIRLGVDGTWVGAYKQSSAMLIAVAPGERHLCASVQSVLPAGKILTVMHFTAEAGKTYYFRTRLLSQYPTYPALELGAVDSDEGQYLVGEYPMAVWKEKK
jgi:hypothetical protein